jgi:DNA-binding CsgD family transcriptional regulator
MAAASSPFQVEACADRPLTRREEEVLRWVARGSTNAQIAATLWLSPGTVRKHLENVFAKLGVHTRTAAVARYLALDDQLVGRPQSS